MPELKWPRRMRFATGRGKGGEFQMQFKFKEGRIIYTAILEEGSYTFLADGHSSDWFWCDMVRMHHIGNLGKNVTKRTLVVRIRDESSVNPSLRKTG